MNAYPAPAGTTLSTALHGGRLAAPIAPAAKPPSFSLPTNSQASGPAGFQKSAPESRAPSVVRHIIDMLRQSTDPDRAKALIETLAGNGTTDVLGAALRAEPSLINTGILVDLANNRLGPLFVEALTRRPELIGTDLVVGLCSGRSELQCLKVVLGVNPELGSAVSVSGQSLGELVTQSSADGRLKRLKLELLGTHAPSRGPADGLESAVSTA